MCTYAPCLNECVFKDDFPEGYNKNCNPYRVKPLTKQCGQNTCMYENDVLGKQGLIRPSTFPLSPPKKVKLQIDVISREQGHTDVTADIKDRKRYFALF